MTFRYTECYLGGLHMGHYLILFAKIKYGGRTWSMGAKFPGLTVIGVSTHEIMCLGGIAMLSHEVEPCIVNHHNDWPLRWSDHWSNTFQRSQKNLILKFNVHNWTKRIILWDLPYWRHQLLRHNLDVMHIEKIFSKNILHIVMDVPGKTKDNVNARLDLEALCAREELHIRTRENGNPFKPKAKYTLSVEQRRVLCEWFRMLSLLHEYSSNFATKVDPSSIRL